MNWNTLISAKRFGLEAFHHERRENRSEFQRDYDRLVFSAPFRRLQNKTQVFPLPGSIFVHNRLTHSLVYKEETTKGTVTHIMKLEQQERVREIAQMMSGEVLTDAAMDAANQLLSQKQ